MCINKKSVSMEDGDSAGLVNGLNDSNLSNITVLGPMGGGVSTVVNLIAGKDVAQVSSDTSRCTRKRASYRIELRDATRNVVPVVLYDIPGFDHSAKSPLEFPSVPISLAIICMEDIPAQVKATAEYLRSKWKKHGDGTIPVLVVISHISPRPDAGWWEENRKHFPSPSVVTDHVCLVRRNKEESTRQLQSCIIQHLSTKRFTVV